VELMTKGKGPTPQGGKFRKGNLKSRLKRGLVAPERQRVGKTLTGKGEKRGNMPISKNLRIDRRVREI